jgi:hypothetical protein
VNTPLTLVEARVLLRADEDGLDFARACVLDQRAAAHQRKDHSWDDRYAAALEALDFIRRAHNQSAKKTARRKKGA